MHGSDQFMQALESRQMLSGSLPQVYTIDPALLAQNKAELAAGKASLQPAFNSLVGGANKNLNLSPLSVMDKTSPAGVSAHDYFSYATYYWPNPHTSSGLPYVFEDGNRNTAMIDKGDVTNLQTVISAVNNLALTYYFTGAESYARQAAKLLETWFINPATMMNPNLNHTQIELGLNSGTPWGIIETHTMGQLVDALGLLNASSAWTQADRKAMASWLGQYETWLQTSDLGKKEAAATNNQGTWYDVQCMSILVYLGETSRARQLAGSFGARRIATEIKSDGSQPLELARADGWIYSLFNLSAMETMANLASRVGVNLWSYQASSGGSILKALTFLAPYASSSKAWPYHHVSTPLSQSDRNGLIPLLLEGQVAYRSRFTTYLNELPSSAVTASGTQLFV